MQRDLKPRRRVALAALAVTMLLAASCAERSGEETTTTGDLGAPVQGLLAVPVPSAARQDPNSETFAADQPTTYIDQYRLPGFTAAQIDAWYGEHLPPGVDWNGWTWCEADTQFPYRENRAYFRGPESLDVNYKDAFVGGDGKHWPTTLQVTYSNQVVPACGSK